MTDKAWRSTNKEHNRKRHHDPTVKLRHAADKRKHRLGKYGLTVEQFELLKASQGGRCAICRRPFKDGKTTHVDHSHLTGRVRGLLCTNCNTGLGMFKDNLALFDAAAAYLRRNDMKQKKAETPEAYSEFATAVRELNKVEGEIIAATEAAQAPLKDRLVAAQERYRAAVLALNNAALENK